MKTAVASLFTTGYCMALKPRGLLGTLVVTQPLILIGWLLLPNKAQNHLLDRCN